MRGDDAFAVMRAGTNQRAFANRLNEEFRHRAFPWKALIRPFAPRVPQATATPAGAASPTPRQTPSARWGTGLPSFRSARNAIATAAAGILTTSLVMPPTEDPRHHINRPAFVSLRAA